MENEQQIQLTPIREHRISRHWGLDGYDTLPIGYDKTVKIPEPLEINLDRFLSKLDPNVSPTPPPKPKLTIEQRKYRLKSIYHEVATQLIQREGKEQYEYTEKTKPILNQLTGYFMGLPDCGLDLRKSILLIGSPGTGKSMVMETWSYVLKHYADASGLYPECFSSFQFKRVIELVRELIKKNESAYILEKLYTRQITNPDCKELRFHICLDDIGKEEIEKAFPYKENPILPIYNARHKILIRQGVQFKTQVRTHATTNFSPQDLIAIYSPAMVDRFYQMFNFIYWPGQSYRKK